MGSFNFLIPRVFFIQFSIYASSFFSSYSCFVRRRRVVQSSSNEENNKDLDLFSNLPRDITMDILSRLPNIGSALKCKVVCKAWRDLISSVDYHLSKPDQHLVYLTNFIGLMPNPYKIVELIREDDEIPHKDQPELVMDLLFSYEFLRDMPPRSSVEGPNNSHLVVLKLALSDDLQVAVLRSSVEGLILLHCQPQHSLLVCNPLTNEYVRIPHPHPPGYCQEKKGFSFGFGLSRSSHQYKVVHIFRGSAGSEGGCQVYALGGPTRQWRSIAAGPTPPYTAWDAERAFVSGNLYWLHPQSEGEFCCFDLETEVFTYFCAPPPPAPQSKRSVCALNECLCLCDVLPTEIVVWLMKGKGGEWSKEYVIRVKVGTSVDYLFPIRVLEDGDMLFSRRDSAEILYYSKNMTKTAAQRGQKRISNLYPPLSYMSYKARTAVYTPNFLSLKTLFMGEEDVQSFF